MTTLTKTLACVMALMLLTACGSSPRNEYYRLTATPGQEPQGESPSLGIGPISVPAYLDREKLVYGKEGNRIQIADTVSWAEPVDAGVERVIAMNLAMQLNTQNVRTFPWHPKRAPDYGIKVNLLSLDSADSEATLTAEWLVYRPGGAESVERRITRFSKPLGDGQNEPSQLPGAYSALLLELSKAIAAAIQADMSAQ